MTENTRLAHPRKSATPFIIAGVVAVIGAYSLMHLAVQSGSHKTVDASRITQTPRPVEVGHATHAQHAKMNRVEFNDLTNSETGKPFEAGEVQQRLQDFLIVGIQAMPCPWQNETSSCPAYSAQSIPARRRERPWLTITREYPQKTLRTGKLFRT